MPAAMIEAALDELTPDQRDKITPAQSAALLQVGVSCVRGLAFILETPAVRVLKDQDKDVETQLAAGDAASQASQPAAGDSAMEQGAKARAIEQQERDGKEAAEQIAGRKRG